MTVFPDQISLEPVPAVTQKLDDWTESSGLGTWVSAQQSPLAFLSEVYATSTSIVCDEFPCALIQLAGSTLLALTGMAPRSGAIWNGKKGGEMLDNQSEDHLQYPTFNVQLPMIK
jgi:hypothetical protein